MYMLLLLSSVSPTITIDHCDLGRGYLTHGIT